MNEIDWKKVFIIGIVGLILVVSIGSSVYLFIQYRKAKSLLTNPQQSTKEQQKELVKQVAKLIELPDEEPTIATVLDKDKLEDQPFFKKAQNGDKVLVFSQAKKALLYRPSQNKIIEFSPINLGETAGTSIASPSAKETTPTPTPKEILLKPSPKPTAAIEDLTPTPTP